MQYAVPIVSWLVCVGVSFQFTLAWSFSGWGTSGPYLDASAYLWAALPALLLSTLLLARGAKPMRWISCSISALPWAIYPWGGLAGAPSGERRQWFQLGEVLCIAFAICVAVPVVLRVAHSQRSGKSAAPAQ
jgi:hypothetical protein